MGVHEMLHKQGAQPPLKCLFLPMVAGACLMKFLLVYSESLEPFLVPLSCVLPLVAKLNNSSRDFSSCVVSLAEIVIH